MDMRRDFTWAPATLKRPKKDLQRLESKKVFWTPKTKLANQLFLLWAHGNGLMVQSYPRPDSYQILK